MWSGIVSIVSVVVVISVVGLIRAMNKEARRADYKN